MIYTKPEDVWAAEDRGETLIPVVIADGNRKRIAFRALTRHERRRARRLARKKVRGGYGGVRTPRGRMP